MEDEFFPYNWHNPKRIVSISPIKTNKQYLTDVHGYVKDENGKLIPAYIEAYFFVYFDYLDKNGDREKIRVEHFINLENGYDGIEEAEEKAKKYLSIKQEQVKQLIKDW